MVEILSEKWSCPLPLDNVLMFLPLFYCFCRLLPGYTVKMLFSILLCQSATHCSILPLWEMWLSSTLHTHSYSPLCFWYSHSVTVSASRFRIPDFIAVGSYAFPSSATLHRLSFLFLSESNDRNPLRTHSNQTLRHFFFQTNKPALFSTLCCCLSPPQIPVYCLFKLAVNCV